MAFNRGPRFSAAGREAAEEVERTPAGTPSLNDAQSGAQPNPSRHQTPGDGADSTGESHEWKVAALLFLRMLVTGHEFQLESSKEAAGPFDGIVLRYRIHSSDPWRVTRMQLEIKREKNSDIPKSELVGFAGGFSLVKYCASYASMEGQGTNDQFILFTNANIDASLVDKVQADPFLGTGGTVVSFKAGGEVYRELCEWVDFKEALTVLNGQVDGLQGKEVGTRVKAAFEDVMYQNKDVTAWKNDLIALPTLAKLKELLDKLKLVSDKNGYSSFLAKLHVYSNQAHESEVEAKIKEELAKVWIHSDSRDSGLGGMYREFTSRMKSWWQNAGGCLSHDSPLWLGVVKTQTDLLSKSTTDRLTSAGAEFVEGCLKVLHAAIPRKGVVHVQVGSRTAASSLKALQALAVFRAHANVLHVNVQALLGREDAVIAAWATRWCPVLVLECDVEVEQKNAARIVARILKVASAKGESKLLVLIAPEKHELSVQLRGAENFTHVKDVCKWNDLTERTKETILATKFVVNGAQWPFTLLKVLRGETSFVNITEQEEISQMITRDISCGRTLDEAAKVFVTRRLQKSADGVPFVVDSVRDVLSKVVLVVAEPGMGKSALITHLANQAKAEFSTTWIMHIKLGDCARHLKEIEEVNFNIISILRFLEQTAFSGGSSLEKMLFGALQQYIVLFIDGVDEVCPLYEQQVFKLIRFLRGMKFNHFWVASRPVVEKKLEDALGVKAHHLVALSKKDQADLISKSWLAEVPSATSEKCSEATASLMTWLTNSSGADNSSILGSPLVTAMLAETYQEQILTMDFANCRFKTNERLDVMSVFTAFVKMKFDQYLNEPKASNREETFLNGIGRISRNHSLAALHLVFGREEVDGLQRVGKEGVDEELTSFLKEVTAGRETKGLIDRVDDGIPHFVHRSLAEFFAATWLAANYKSNGQFIERILFSPEYQQLSEMFNRSLAENRPLHTAVLNRDLETIVRVLIAQPKSSAVDAVDAVDVGGRTPLHLAVLRSAGDPHPDCVRIVEYLLEKHRAKHDVADLVLGWEPLRYAERSGAWTAHHVILSNGGNAKKMCGFGLIQAMFNKPKSDSRLLLDAAKGASVLVVRYLAEERGGKLDCRGPNGETMIHKAAQRQHVEMLEFLRKKGLSFGIKDKELNTALHYATPQTVSYLLRRGLDLEAVNSQGLTALHVAAQGGEYDLMAALVEARASFAVSAGAQTSAARLNASLLCAAATGSDDTAKALVEMGASPDHRDDNGHTAAWVAWHRRHHKAMNLLLLLSGGKDGDISMHAACRVGEPELVAYMLSLGVDLEARGWQGQTPLIAALSEGQLDVVTLLLEKGADIKCRDEQGWTPLHHASRHGFKKVVALLLRKGANIEAVNKQGMTPLHVAMGYYNVDLTTLLLANGANVNCRDEDSCTPLHRASTLGHTQVAALLLRMGADVDAVDAMSLTPLHQASVVDEPEAVQLLLARGAEVDRRDKVGRTALNQAAELGHVRVAALLLRHGADMRAPCALGFRPIHSAALKNRPEVVRLLLERGESLQSAVVSGDGATPLHIAAFAGHEQVVSLLLRRGADVDAVDDKGRTPLHCATLKNNVNVVVLLLARGAKVDSQERTGQTALNLAAEAGNEQLAAVLLRHGADMHVETNRGLRAIHCAAMKNYLEVVKLLLESGESAQSLSEGEHTALHHVAAFGYVQVAALLLRHGADVNAVNDKGWTPLHFASTNNSVDMVLLLLSGGAKVNARDENGRTPLYQAARNANEQVAGVLIRHGADLHNKDVMGMTPTNFATGHIQGNAVKHSIVRMNLVTDPSLP